MVRCKQHAACMQIQIMKASLGRVLCVVLIHVHVPGIQINLLAVLAGVVHR
jgi:hypothetical protein